VIDEIGIQAVDLSLREYQLDDIYQLLIGWLGCF
jgi:hypothetical protein